MRAIFHHAARGRSAFAAATFLAIAAIRCSGGVAFAASPPSGVAVLQTYAGKWVSDGEFYLTPYSRQAHVTGVTTCQWSPMKNSLVCDQLVHSGSSDQRDTALYAFDDATNQYRFAEFPFDGTPPHVTQLTISGGTWSYVGGFTDDKTSVVFRTTDVFTGDVEKWRVDFSLDEGKKWIPMGAGAAKRIGN